LSGESAPAPTAFQPPAVPIATAVSTPPADQTAPTASPADTTPIPTIKPSKSTKSNTAKEDGEATAVSPLTLTLIQSHWREMVNRAGAENKNLPALLNMGKPLAVEGSTAVIGFDYPIFKMKFDDTRGAAQLLGKVLSELTGQNCQIRSVNTTDYTVTVDKKAFASLADELGGVVSEE